MAKTVDMTVGNPTKHILKFAFPLLLANIGQQLYMIVDAAIVGRGVGVKALASVGATDWTYWLILWTVTGLSQGFATFISRHFGNKDYKKMNKAITMSVILCFIIGLILTILGIIISRPLLELLKTPGDIIDGATTYLITMISGTFIVTAYNMASSILRAFGDGKSPLIAMIIAGLLNIGLDCLFVFTFKMGILGAAIATLLAQFVSFIFCLFKIKNIEVVKLTKEDWKFDFLVIKKMILFGIPIAFQYIIIALGGILLQSSVNTQGSIFIAGYTATNKVYGLLECSAVSIGLACSTYLAQNFGSKKYDRVKNGIKTSLKIVAIMAIIIFILIQFFKRILLQLFLDINEPGGLDALDIAVNYLSIMSFFLIILNCTHVYRNALQAMEISIWSLISGIAEFICRVFMAKIVINWIGSNALFISEPISWTGALLSVIIPYYIYQKNFLKNNLKIANKK